MKKTQRVKKTRKVQARQSAPRTQNTRATAARALMPVLQDKGALKLDGANSSTGDHALLMELCFGSLRQYPRLKLMLRRLVTKPLKETDMDIEALIIVGLYQLFFMRVPDHAAINETVNGTAALKKKWARGLVNAVLRNAQRKKSQIEKDLADNLEFRSAHPHWLAESIQRDWPDQAEEIFAAGNQKPPMVLRVNQQTTPTASYLEALQEAEINAQTLGSSSVGLRLESPCSVSALPDFDKGSCSVQDEAAQWVAPILQAQPGHRVLDACAAPGGKTCHILESVSDIDLTAIDIDEDRTSSIRDNLDRLKLSANVVTSDSADPNSWWDKRPFDRILIDAPCSGSGVIRRHPDIKLLRRESDIAQFAAQQRRLLGSLWPLLAPDGLLLYVTCSIMPAENEAQIRAFLAKHEDAELIPIDCDPAILQSVIVLDLGIQSLPSREGADGFYFALIKKRLRD